jgi:flagellar protein FliJ
MGDYKFPLQKLLDIRLSKEDESKRNFMEAQRQKRLAEEKLEELKDSYKKYNVENVEDDILTRRIKDNYLRALNSNIDNTKVDITIKGEHVELHREDLKQKQIDRKTVETLKEKRHEIFKKEQDDKERKTNDEFALYSYIRKIERG